MSFALRRASEEQAKQRDVLCHQAWGSRLTIDQFCAREDLLRHTAWSTSAMRTWVLSHCQQGTVASCETFRMQAQLSHAGVQKEGHIEAVASVFVEPALRGNHYASVMLERVVDVARTEGALGVILFSEVGATIYERTGFVVAPTTEWVLDVNLSHKVVSENATPLSRSEVAALIDSRSPDPEGLFVKVSASQYEWHIAREEFYRDTLGVPAVPFAGLKRGDCWLCWARPVSTQSLVVLCAGGDGDLATWRALFDATSTAATQCGADFVEVWESDLPTTAQQAVVERSPSAPHEKSTLPMVLALQPGANCWRPSRCTWVLPLPTYQVHAAATHRRSVSQT